MNGVGPLYTDKLVQVSVRVCLHWEIDPIDE